MYDIGTSYGIDVSMYDIGASMYGIEVSMYDIGTFMYGIDDPCMVLARPYMGRATARIATKQACRSTHWQVWRQKMCRRMACPCATLAVNTA